MILIGGAIHVLAGLRAGTRRIRWQRFAIGATGLVPLLAHVGFAASGFTWPRDPTPIALMPVGIALASALFPGGLLDVRPLVQQELIERLPLGVVLADRSGAVIDVNPHAQYALGLTQGQAHGRTLEAVLAGVDPGYRVEISEVMLAGRRLAHFAFLHPPAPECNAEAA